MLNYSSPLENNKKIKKKILHAVSNTIDSGQYILGNNVKIFERKLAKYLKVKYVIALKHKRSSQLRLYSHNWIQLGLFSSRD